MHTLIATLLRRAEGARLAGQRIKSVRVASLYTAGASTLTITWAAPDVWLDDKSPAAGVSTQSWTRPADTCITLPARARLADLEIEVLDCAWQLGAWDVRRIEHAPIADPQHWREMRYGIANDFGRNNYTIMDHPLAVGDRAADAVCEQAAREGRISWAFIALALCTDAMQRRWRDKDRTLTDTGACTRLPKHINGAHLYGPCAVGTAHEHIYQMGRGNHGNRSKTNAGRRA